MKAIKIIIWSLAGLTVVVVAFLGYLGLLMPLHPFERDMPSYRVIGVEVKGDYSEIGKQAEMVKAVLKGSGFEHTPGIGIYYDDPEKTPVEKRRSFVGQIFQARDLQRVMDLQLAGLKIDSVPGSRAVAIELPLRNSFSYMLGPMKVYPAFGSYCGEKHYIPGLAVEIYDADNGRIIYMMQYQQAGKPIDY